MRTRELHVAAVFLAMTTLARTAGAQAGPPMVVTEPSAPRTVALEDVVGSVTAGHPLLRAAGQDIAMAEADLLSAEGGFDPVLRARGSAIPFGPYRNERLEVIAEQPTGLWGTKFFGGWRIGRGSFAVYDGKAETGSYGEGRVGLQVPLWRDGPIDRRRAGIRKAEIGRGVAEAFVEQQRLDLVRAASHRYWDWVAAGRRLVVARALLDVGITRDAALAARAERGDIPAFERGENTRAVQQRRSAVIAAQRSLQNASIELSLFYRDASGTPIIPPESAMPPTLPEPSDRGLQAARAEEVALARRPELRRLEAVRAQARVDRDLANNQRKLGFDVYGAGIKDFGETEPKLAKPELEVGLMIDVPIMTRVQDGRVKAAEATLARTTDQERFARDRIVADVRDASGAVDLSLERISAVRSEIDASRRLVEAEMQRFELGEGTLLLVNLREQALGEAQQREVDALADYHKALASQRAAVAQPVSVGRGR